MTTKSKGRIVPTDDELVWLIGQTAEKDFALDLHFGPSGSWLNEASPYFDDAVKLLAWKRGIGTEGVAGPEYDRPPVHPRRIADP